MSLVRRGGKEAALGIKKTIHMKIDDAIVAASLYILL